MGSAAPAGASGSALPAGVRPGEVGGAQSIKRALTVLRYVASRPEGAPRSETPT